MIIRHFNRLNSQFRTNSSESNPLALKVCIIKGKFRNWACFRIGYERELISSSIPSSHVKPNEIACLWSDCTTCSNVNFSSPIDDLIDLLHSEHSRPCTDSNGSCLVTHDPMDHLFRPSQIRIFRTLEFHIDGRQVVC